MTSEWLRGQTFGVFRRDVRSISNDKGCEMIIYIGRRSGIFWATVCFLPSIEGCGCDIDVSADSCAVPRRLFFAAGLSEET